MARLYQEVRSGKFYISPVIMYRYCMDGAIEFCYGENGEAIRLTLWPEIMCFEVCRLGRLWGPVYGKIIAWDSDQFTLEYDFDDKGNDYPFVTEALAYAMGYLNVKSFRYEKKYHGLSEEYKNE